MSSRKIPPFKVITKKKISGKVGYYCNICNVEFKKPTMTIENQQQHEDGIKHTDAVAKKKAAANCKQGMFDRWKKKPSRNDSETKSSNNSNTNNSNTNHDDSDDDVLIHVRGREGELAISQFEEEKDIILGDVTSGDVNSGDVIEFIDFSDNKQTLEAFDGTILNVVFDFLNQRSLRLLSYASRATNTIAVTYLHTFYGGRLLNDLLFEAETNKLVEPPTLSLLKEQIINYRNNCIVFFEKNSREYFKCTYCINNIDIVKIYSVTGIRGCLCMDGALARKKSIWYHLVGVHLQVEQHQELIDKEYEDSWVSIQIVLEKEEISKLLAIHGFGSAMRRWIADHSDEFFINLHTLSIRCQICFESYQIHNDNNNTTVWTFGRKIDNLRTEQLNQHIGCGCHGNNNTILTSTENKEDIEEKDIEIELDSTAHIALGNRVKTILWMMKEKLPPHRFKSTMKLLQSQGTPNLGVSGTSSTVVHKMFHMCGVYVGAVYIQYILKYVTAMCLGCDCVKTSDDIKVCHFNLRFVVEAYPITIHFGSRKIVGSCTGEKLFQTLQNLVEWRDLEDVNYVGISVGKTYYELDDEKEIRQLINVIGKMKESGMKISFNWVEFIDKLHSFVSDAGGDVFGKNIGLRGRLMKAKKDQCGVELMTTHGICHQIDIIAQKHLLICTLFAEIIDFITSFRSFINASEFRINWYRQECINQCAKYLVIARKFETRWIIATYQALKAWKNNYKGTIFFLEQCKDEVIGKCSKIDDRNRVSAKIESLTDDICCIKSHMMAYAAEDLMRPIATKWQAMSESEALNVISAINDVNEVQRIISIKKTNIDRDSRMYPWMTSFHDENVVNHIPHGKRITDMVYRWDKYDKDDSYYYKQLTKSQYSKLRKELKAMYIESCDEFLDEIETYKDKPQFKYWLLFKNIADYTLWQLNTPHISEAKQYIQLRSKEAMASLYDSKYKTFVLMGMKTCTKEEFINGMVIAQEFCLEAIESFRTDDEIGKTLAQIYQRKDISFYDIWAIAYDSIGDKQYKYVHDLFISINPGNPFSERQGRIMNIVRNKLAHNTKLHLLDTKLHGHFNLPTNIIDSTHQQHIDTLNWIWRNVVRGHDVVKPNNLQKRLDLSVKLPKIKAKSYHSRKRAIKKDQSKSSIWSKIKIKLSGLKIRSFKNRGKK
eukprot:542162_1